MVLKELREKKGLTQKELAEKAEINIRMVQYLENGERKIENTTLKTAKKIAKALNIELSELY